MPVEEIISNRVMLSNRLAKVIEDHWEQLLSGTMREIYCDPGLPHLHGMDDALREEIRQLMKYLGKWLSTPYFNLHAQEHEQLGKVLYEKGSPPHEIVRAIHVAKHHILSYALEEGLPQSAVDLYAQEEFEHRLGLLFECVIYYVLRGYWTAAVRQAG
jgi:hypothetical protein